MSHLGQAFDFVFLISFMTCSVKFKFSECSQRRNLSVCNSFNPLLYSSNSHPMPFIFTHSIRTRHSTSLQKKRFSKRKFPQPSFIPICKCSLYFPILSCFLSLSWKKECSFLSPFQVLWSRIVVPKVGYWTQSRW